ncbi:MAG: MBOAT family protein [Flavobacteriales bacterium]|nr:MBOAT family protein [Flavobacteriales bacterium]
MVFSSPVFLFLFLPLVLLVVLVLRDRKQQNVALLVASLFFYSWGEGAYLLLMLALVLVNYLCALARERWATGSSSVIIAVVLNLGALLWFKYANFLVASLNVVLAKVGAEPLHLDPVHLPIGVSFFIFQGLSYVIDVHRGQASAQGSPGTVALYISLFPQLIAGPIVRYRDVAEQIGSRSLSPPLFASGIRRFVVGLAKKVLIADQVARIAEPIFSLSSTELSPAVAWLGLVAYAVQIYFDFSGYSDMAIGLGRMFGFRFLENFNRPYIALSIREFWQRWHISLSSWFRDYLYIPLGGNRRGPIRTYLNLFIVFFLTGLWHGASWNFVVWGLMHGLFMVFERAGLGKLLARSPKPLAGAYTLLIVLLAWVFFRVENITEAWHYVLALFDTSVHSDLSYDPLQFITRTTGLAMLLGVLGSMNVHEWIARVVRINASGDRIGPGLRGGIEVVGIAVLMLLVGMEVSSSTFSPFIYFRF